MEAWGALSDAAPEPLLELHTSLTMGVTSTPIARGTIGDVDAEAHGWTRLDAAGLSEHYPSFVTAPDTMAIVENGAGVFDLERCLQSSLARATAHGADLRFDHLVREWEASSGGVTVSWAEGEARVRRLVLTAGAWAPELLPGVAIPLQIDRTVQHWVAPIPNAASGDASDHVSWVWDIEDGRSWYGFPLKPGVGRKLGLHYDVGRSTTVAGLDRDVHEADQEALRSILQRSMPSAQGPLLSSSVCMYANTPDREFILDRHPRHPEVCLFAGGSGHAFKFVPVLAEVLADLATDREARFDVDHWRLSRF